MTNVWKLAGILVLALPLAACSPEQEEGDGAPPEDETNIDVGDEAGDDLGEAQDAVLDCSIVRKEWDDGAISIKIFKGNEACNSQSNSLDGHYMGIKWECVEFARRYWYRRWGFIFGSVGGAKDICAQFPESQKSYPGEHVPKKKGDMMVLKPGCQSNATYGHVGIIADKTGSTEFKVWDQGDSITDGNANYYDASCAKCFIRDPDNTNPNL